MAKKSKAKISKRRPWSKDLIADLKRHSKAKTPVVKIAKLMKRTPGAIRQKGVVLGIPLGHRR